MKAIRVVDGAPAFVDAPEPSGEGVLVAIESASICGSDLHLIDGGMVEGRILGHEFAGLAPGGTPVAVEPLLPRWWPEIITPAVGQLLGRIVQTGVGLVRQQVMGHGGFEEAGSQEDEFACQEG